MLITDGAPNCSSVLDINTCINTNPDHPLKQSEQCVDSKASANAALSLFAGQQGSGFLAEAMDTGEEVSLSVPTYVVGVGDLAAWDSVMNFIADSGGGETMTDGFSSHYFQATDPKTVTSAFKDIIADTKPCTFPIQWDEVPIKEAQKGCELVKVFKTTDGVLPNDPNERATAELPFSADCSKPDGWYYANVGGDVQGLPLYQCSTIELCNQSCNDLKFGLIEDLSFQFGCRPINGD